MRRNMQTLHYSGALSVLQRLATTIEVEDISAGPSAATMVAQQEPAPEIEPVAAARELSTGMSLNVSHATRVGDIDYLHYLPGWLSEAEAEALAEADALADACAAAMIPAMSPIAADST